MTTVQSLLRTREESGRGRGLAKVLLDPLEGGGRNVVWKSLRGHTGCVNALAFSPSTGSSLYSGGDDSRVLVWRADGAAYVDANPSPAAVMKGHHASNVFCVDGDVTETKVMSGGNDCKVMIHDVPTGKTLDLFLHEEAVYGVSGHPVTSSVFATACADGRATLFDVRMAHPDQEGALNLASSIPGDPFLSIQFNPSDERVVLVASHDKGVGASLYDVRTVKRPLLTYGKGPAMFARFDTAGKKVLVLRRRRKPTVYNLAETKAFCSFDSPGYYNNCTMKSGCFGGVDDTFVLAGSDDFKLYAWEIPSEPTTVAQSHHIVLRGHKSIVNQVRCRATDGLIATSGVEKIVGLWSGGAMPGAEVPPDEEEIEERIGNSRVETADGLWLAPTAADQNSLCPTRENAQMLVFFDRLIRRESEGGNSSSSSTSGAGSNTHSATSSSLSTDDHTDLSDPDVRRTIAQIITRKRERLAKKRRNRKRQKRRPPPDNADSLMRGAKGRWLWEGTSSSSSVSSCDEDSTRPRLSGRQLVVAPSSSDDSQSPPPPARRVLPDVPPSSDPVPQILAAVKGRSDEENVQIKCDILAALKEDNMSSSAEEEEEEGHGLTKDRNSKLFEDSSKPSTSRHQESPRKHSSIESRVAAAANEKIDTAASSSAECPSIKMKLDSFSIEDNNVASGSSKHRKESRPSFKKRLGVKGTHKSYRTRRDSSDTSGEEN